MGRYNQRNFRHPSRNRNIRPNLGPRLHPAGFGFNFIFKTTSPYYIIISFFLQEKNPSEKTLSVPCPENVPKTVMHLCHSVCICVTDRNFRGRSRSGSTWVCSHRQGVLLNVFKFLILNGPRAQKKINKKRDRNTEATAACKPVTQPPSHQQRSVTAPLPETPQCSRRPGNPFYAGISEESQAMPAPRDTHVQDSVPALGHARYNEKKKIMSDNPIWRKKSPKGF